ncbi:MAG: hypothetical protein NZ990_16990 [Myxococcota bacterium]|nr:hypothetical protein [Myxococcota bacterium]
MPPPASTHRLRVLLIALAGLAVLVFLLLDGRDGESPQMASQQTSPVEGLTPGSEETSTPSESDAAPAVKDFAGASDAPAPGLVEPATPGFYDREFQRGSQPPGGQALASGSGGDDSPTAEEIEQAIQRARSIQALEAGGLAARNNPTRPPAIVKALNTPRFVPPEIEEAAGASGDTPPEIMEAMRERRVTPPEIAQAMADAAERGTSDSMRAYMAGESDQRPAQ